MIVSFRERSREPIVFTQDAKDASGITEPLQSPSPSDGEILMGESLMVNMRISNLANVALDTIQMKVCKHWLHGEALRTRSHDTTVVYVSLKRP